MSIHVVKLRHSVNGFSVCTRIYVAVEMNTSNNLYVAVYVCCVAFDTFLHRIRSRRRYHIVSFDILVIDILTISIL